MVCAQYSTSYFQINNPGNLGYVPNLRIVNLLELGFFGVLACALGTSLNSEQFHLPQHLMFSGLHSCVSDLWRTVQCLVHPLGFWARMSTQWNSSTVHPASASGPAAHPTSLLSTLRGFSFEASPQRKAALNGLCCLSEALKFDFLALG